MQEETLSLTVCECKCRIAFIFPCIQCVPWLKSPCGASCKSLDDRATSHYEWLVDLNLFNRHSAVSLEWSREIRKLSING